MRYSIAAALALIAVPAAAQRLDAHRIDVAETLLEHSISGYRCGFGALPGLVLQHATEPGWANASWNRAAEGRTAEARGC